MITIKNRLRKIRIDTEALKKDVKTLLDVLGYSDFDLGIWLTTNETIRNYNRQYRRKNEPTDILSFAYHHDIKPGKKIVPSSEEDKNLGDLIIAPEYLKQSIKGLSTTLKKRLQVLLVHGVCHLIGYVHETETQYQRMKKKEQELLALLTSKK